MQPIIADVYSATALKRPLAHVPCSNVSGRAGDPRPFAGLYGPLKGVAGHAVRPRANGRAPTFQQFNIDRVGRAGLSPAVSSTSEHLDEGTVIDRADDVIRRALLKPSVRPLDSAVVRNGDDSVLLIHSSPRSIRHRSLTPHALGPTSSQLLWPFL